MKSIREADTKGKRVLVRCDFNVPLDDKGNILDDFRIEKTIPTVRYLLKNGAKIILMSHLGKPKGEFVKGLSLSPIQEKLMEYLDVSIVKAGNCMGKEIENWTKEMKEGEILLLENLRFHKGEEEGDLNFAKELAKLGDIYVNDAFAQSHRPHASVVGLPKLLPSFAGLLMEEEINAFSKILKKPKRPMVGIIGGAKADSKMKPVNSFLKNFDFLLIGGKIANLILTVKGISVGRPFPEEEIIKEIEKIDLTNLRLRLPIDVKASSDEKGELYTRICGPANARRDEMILDIGPETIKLFSELIKKAKTIFWSGPLGMIEEKKFVSGTLAVAKAIVDSDAFSVAGGGDTVAFLREYNLSERLSYLSTGGGAMLEFLSGTNLPGIEALG